MKSGERENPMDDADGGGEETTMEEGCMSARPSMMSARTRTLVEAIHSSPTQSVLYLVGGASQVTFTAKLMCVIESLS